MPNPLAVPPLPDSPPAEVLAEVDAAAEHACALADRDRELHFEIDAAGRTIVELRTLDGEVIRRIAGSEALAVMAGLADVD